jgi:hypothetical protein
MDSVKIKKSIYESSMANSAGDWESLNYRLINAAKMRNFLKYIAVYGNSLHCEQAAVDNIEAVLRKYGNFFLWKKQNTEAIRMGLSNGFIYLFVHLNSEAGNVDANIDKCLAEASTIISDVKEFVA